MKKDTRFKNRVVVVGGGPAGMMAALAASENHEVTLLESQEELGKKLLITGGGRCNVTFKGDRDTFFSNVFPNPKFLYPAFTALSNNDLLHFFQGISFIEEGQKIYPSTEQASTIRDFLQEKLIERRVEILCSHRVEDVHIDNGRVCGVLLGDTLFEAKHVILCPGGKSYPGTGSDGRLMKHIPLKKTPSYGVLVGINTLEDLSALSGVSLQVKATYKKKPYWGELLLTHKGISGPLAFKISQCYDHKEADIHVDFLEQLSSDELGDILFTGNHPLKTLGQFLPKALVSFLLEGMTDRHQLKKADRQALIRRFKDFIFTIDTLGSTESAIVTRGGVALREVDPATMKCKGIQGLSLAGECLDLDGSSGGFNLQIAFSTGYLAGSKL